MSEVAATTPDKLQPNGKPRGIPFKSGAEWTGNAKGRPKGSRHKLGEAFIEAMSADFEVHGSKVIEQVRIEKPDQYLKVVASILPKELNVNTNAMSEMSDDELAAVIAAMRTLAASVDLALAGSGSGEAQGAEPPSAVSPVH